MKHVLEMLRDILGELSVHSIEEMSCQCGEPLFSIQRIVDRVDQPLAALVKEHAAALLVHDVAK